jgi:hypothetical protein
MNVSRHDPVLSMKFPNEHPGPTDSGTENSKSK